MPEFRDKVSSFGIWEGLMEGEPEYTENAASFEELFEKHKKAIEDKAEQYYLRHKEKLDYAELLSKFQDAFKNCYARYYMWQGEIATLKSFHTAAKNRCKDLLRKTHRKQHKKIVMDTGQGETIEWNDFEDKGGRPPWKPKSEADLSVLREMYLATDRNNRLCYTIAFIAHRFGVNRATIQAYAKRNGWSRRTPLLWEGQRGKSLSKMMPHDPKSIAPLASVSVGEEQEAQVPRHGRRPKKVW